MLQSTKVDQMDRKLLESKRTTTCSTMMGLGGKGKTSKKRRGEEGVGGRGGRQVKSVKRGTTSGRSMGEGLTKDPASETRSIGNTNDDSRCGDAEGGTFGGEDDPRQAFVNIPTSSHSGREGQHEETRTLAYVVLGGGRVNNVFMLVTSTVYSYIGGCGRKNTGDGKGRQRFGRARFKYRSVFTILRVIHIDARPFNRWNKGR